MQYDLDSTNNFIVVIFKYNWPFNPQRYKYSPSFPHDVTSTIKRW